MSISFNTFLLQGPGGGNFFVALLPWIIIFGVVYVLINRARRRKISPDAKLGELDANLSTPPHQVGDLSVWPFLLGGAFIGGVIAFLLRPSAPFIGQLDLNTVMSRGSNLRGLDQLLVSTAQASFNLLVAGILVGAVIGAIIGSSRSKKKAGVSIQDATSSQTESPQLKVSQEKIPDTITEHIRKLADLKNDGILTEQEFQDKKSELLKRL